MTATINEHTRPLNLTADRAFLRKLLDAATAFDVMKDPVNVYDARSGCINLWCREGDVPACWDAPLSPGAWGKSELVGEICWEWAGEQVSLRVEVWPHNDLIRYRRKEILADKTDPRRFRRAAVYELPLADVRCLLDWLEAKARALVRLARLQPLFVGHKCPWCDWILPTGGLLNDLTDHVAVAHADHLPVTLVLGERVSLLSTAGTFPLEVVEDFSR